MPNITPSRAKNSIHRSLSQIVYGYPNNKDKQAIWQYFGGRCAYCDCQIEPRKGHLDHLIAMSDGGTNDKHNFVLACNHCNGDEKREQDWIVFLKYKCQNLPKSVFDERYEKIKHWQNQATIRQLDPKVEQEINQIINQAKLEFDKAVVKMRALKQSLYNE